MDPVKMSSFLGFNTYFAPFSPSFTKLKNVCNAILQIHLLKARLNSFHYQRMPAESR